MISARMRRLLLAALPMLVFAVLAGGCGTEKISLAQSDPNYAGAVLFNQRCSGCHTLSYAATHGSAVKVTTKQYNNGPNFDVRCERTAQGQGIARVLYAIENGGFSGAVMPQNIVVGQQAIEVAKFVATYSGRKAPRVPGVPACDRLPLGSVPTLTTASATTSTAAASTPTTASASSYPPATSATTKSASKKTPKRGKRKR
jgi:mono/diheme cytochrome c family protein